MWCEVHQSQFADQTLEVCVVYRLTAFEFQELGLSWDNYSDCSPPVGVVVRDDNGDV